jgi:hypothetical protein
VIRPTENDVGRRVALSRPPFFLGTIKSVQPCGHCRGPCILVHFDGEKFPHNSDPNLLNWADRGEGDLL